MTEKAKRGRLYVVSIHIGNIEDITKRAIEVLNLCDLIVCEELKVGSVLLKELRINKRLDTLNEQNENEKVFEYIKMIKEDDKKIAIISDCGTPVFADPGYQLVKNCLLADINIVVIPGVTSLMTALVRSGFPLNQFLYAGFLSRKKDERIEQLLSLSKEKRTVAVYDTPYRLLPLLEDAKKVMPNRNVYVGMNLTMPFETHHYGTFKELYDKFKENKIKAEFVVCFEGNEVDISKYCFVKDDDEIRRSFDKSKLISDKRRKNTNDSIDSSNKKNNKYKSNFKTDGRYEANNKKQWKNNNEKTKDERRFGGRKREKM